MVVTKLSQNEWAALVEKGIRKHKHERELHSAFTAQERFFHFINNHRVIPIAIGAGACFAVFFIWGWQELLNMLFSWVIGIVVVTTLVAGLLHPGHPIRKV